MTDDLLQLIIDALKDLKEAVLAPPHAPQGDTELIIGAVNVTAAGTPVHGPSMDMPKGRTTTVRMRRHAGSPTGYVAVTSPGAEHTLTRIELKDNDSVNGIEVSNWNLLWFDGASLPTGGVFFELFGNR